MNDQINENISDLTISLSLIPVNFRGSIKDFFDCYGLNINSLLDTNSKLENLSYQSLIVSGKIKLILFLVDL